VQERVVKRVLTVTGDLWEGNVEFNAHLFLAATIDDQRGLDMNGPVVHELSNQQDEDDECTGQGDYSKLP